MKKVKKKERGKKRWRKIIKENKGKKSGKRRKIRKEEKK